MMLGVDPKVDYAFRKLFATEANSDLLIDLLNAVLKPPQEQRIAAVEILTPFNDQDTADDKTTILDIKARDQLGRQYNVEMEMCPTGTFPQRLLYYWAVLHAGQLVAGDGYDKLQPTISICFVNRRLFPQVADYHLDFQLRSARHPQLIFSLHQAVHVVELPKFVKKVEELVDPLDAWCYFLTNGESLDPDNPPAPFTGPAARKAMEVLTMLKQTELEWHRYQSELKARRDRKAELKDTRDEGLALGDIVGRIHAYQELLNQPATPPEELLILSQDELLAKAAALKQALAR